ncbi:MAG: hypothetical protein RLZ76_246 [Bacteroidota bacterium]
MDLSIIIVNYNSSHHVINCIDSIMQSNMRISYEIIVVDNDSNADDFTSIQMKFPDVKCLQMGYNAGFARANNHGIENSTGEYILLLNADTIIKEDAIEKVYHTFSRQDKYIACGVQLLNEDGSVQHSGARFVRGGANTLLPLPYLGSFIRKCAKSLSVKQPNVFEVNNDIEVDWVVGAFLLTSKKAIQKAGMLDNDFFMYAEEIEWCSRLRKWGPLILYNNMAVIHLGGGSSSNYYNIKKYDNSNDLWSKKAQQIIVSQMLRVRRQWGLAWFSFIAIFYIIEIPIFIVGLIVENIFKMGKASFSFTQFVGYCKNIIRSLPHFMNIALNKHLFYKIQ